MRFLTCIRSGVVFLAAFLLVYPLVSSARAFISEVMWMGTDMATQDEWVEIAGDSTDTDVSGWKLTSVNTSGNEVTILQFATGTILPADAYRVIARYPAANSRLLEEPWFTSSTMTLPNSKLLLRIRDAQGNVIDQADDGAGEPFAGENPSGGAKASMERITLGASGFEKTNWKTSSAVFGWDEGVTIYGSPGRAYEGFSSSFSSSSNSSSIPEEPLFNCSNYEHIFISEFLPDALGADENSEWIEVVNPTSEQWFMSDWTFDLGSTSRYTIPDLHIDAGSHLVIPLGGLGITLPNAGGTLVLRDSGERECDRVTYPKAIAGVTFGRDEGLQWIPQCRPSPGEPNNAVPWAPELAVESGSTIGAGKTKVNFILTTVEGFMGSIQCQMDYGDGQKVQTCDPGWHTYSAPGSYAATMNATNACGTTVTQTQNIFVSEKTQAATSVTATASAARVTAVPRDIPLIISAVLPNPAGDDKGLEWVELTNTSQSTVSSAGVVFVAGSKASTPLGDEVFAPREKRRYMVSFLGLRLGNEDASLELQDGFGKSLSVLRWGKAREGVVYRFSSFGSRRVGKVTRVIDGDTFEVILDADSSYTEEVRLLGVDAPETVHPTKKPEAFGKDSINLLKALLENKKVELEFDAEERDAYGRALAYVSVLPDRESVQERMITEGLVRVDEQHLYSRKDHYLNLQNSAKDQKVGLWAVSTKASKSSKSSSSEKSASAHTGAGSTAKYVPIPEYESKVIYSNVIPDSGLAALTPEEGHVDDEDLYASLLEDQTEFYEGPEESSGISSGVVLLLLGANSLVLFGALAGGFFMARRLQNSSMNVQS